jgi:hypothetical protein
MTKSNMTIARNGKENKEENTDVITGIWVIVIAILVFIVCPIVVSAQGTYLNL